MKRFFKSSAFALTMAAFVSHGSSVHAEPLSDALVRAYQTNPTLESQRKELEATLYLLPEAQSNFRPTFDLDASADWRRNDNQIKNPTPGVTSKTDISPQEVGVSLTQPLYRGGRTDAQVREARNQINASLAQLSDTEQAVLLSAVTAYFDLEQARATLTLRQKNESVLKEQLQATNDRFEVGELTKTDVSQAESRLAESTASRIVAEGEVEKAIAVYEQIMGQVDGIDFAIKNDIALVLPNSIGEAVDLALKNHPQIQQAIFNQNAAVEGKNRVRGELLPEVNIVGSATKGYDPSTFVEESDQMAIGLAMTMPLYEGGAVRSRMQRADRVASQRMTDIAVAQRAVRQSVIDAWNEYQSSRAQIDAINAQIEASRVALEGVRAEASVGTRTTLDILDAEQEFLNAQVSLVGAERNLAISQFALLQAMGDLNVQTLGLDVPYYSATAMLERLDGNWMVFE